MEEKDAAALGKEINEALSQRDPYRLRGLSEECTDLAFMTQDPKAILLGIISYAFHKVLLKKHYHFQFGPLTESARSRLSRGDLEGVLEDLKDFDRKHGFFQGNVVKKARIKMGARLYTRGISLSLSAQLVSVNVSDILKYAGGTQVHEKSAGSVSERLDVARKLFE